MINTNLFKLINAIYEYPDVSNNSPNVNITVKSSMGEDVSIGVAGYETNDTYLSAISNRSFDNFKGAVYHSPISDISNTNAGLPLYDLNGFDVTFDFSINNNVTEMRYTMTVENTGEEPVTINSFGIYKSGQDYFYWDSSYSEWARTSNSAIVYYLAGNMSEPITLAPGESTIITGVERISLNG